MANVLQFKKSSKKAFYSSLSATVILGALAGNVLFDYKSEIAAKASTAIKQVTTHTTACNIKGNISINTGEKIFHVPGQRYYSQTIISPMYGERWFCSEAEAYKAGWRKARI